MPRSAILLLLPLLWVPLTSPACTLWGEASSQGVLLAKNRDWAPDHRQVLRLIHPAQGLPYLGLFAVGGREPGIKAGVNQAGLTVVTAAASGLLRALRATQPGKNGQIARILERYHSVAEVVAAAPALFGSARAGFYLLGDAHEMLLVEVGTEGRFLLTRETMGRLAHTNHYFDPDLVSGLDRQGESSVIRLQRIRSLLAGTAGALTLDDLSRFSRDQAAGPDDSLWRSGREVTLAGWQMMLPVHGTPVLRVWLANPGEPEQQREWVLDAAFWAASAREWP
ncbi:carcinine hydrolase/isopenicillin-N N-acyltransferase family protein [Chitinilyticum piscinae]|uniref:Peptidase C45 hydrolase domain-containing protein n=1 Tax=Chitinilyticum piscinae TaxID=2866724 RepID=A0A8J7FJD9_9NEIS|nr:carcinine hydrolase/isopenicillin-N N-acyltransferase family protein [Chitinilyticum piscinae]MBE9610465.1 hypothetical protein [Chitinilyticum piscinae]